MKPCNRCKKTLPLSDFYAHPRMADGHLNICKECHKLAVRSRYREVGGRPEYERARSKRPARKAAAQGYAQRSRERHPDRYRAHNAVNNALRDGRLQRQPCKVCGNLKAEAHHEDYSKPLSVEWLCFRHHREHGHGQAVRRPP